MTINCRICTLDTEKVIYRSKNVIYFNAYQSCKTLGIDSRYVEAWVKEEESNLMRLEMRQIIWWQAVSLAVIM